MNEHENAHEIEKLSAVQLSLEDREDILQRLELRMSQFQESSPRRARKRSGIWMPVLGTMTAAVVGVFLVYSYWPGHGTTPQRTAEPPPAVSAPDDDQAQQRLAKEILSLARQGEVPNCPFAADTTMMDHIYEAWGQPDQQDAAGKGIYATYTKRAFAFGFNKGNQVFDVRTYAEDIHKLTLLNVKKAIGEPDHVNKYENQDILVYPASSTFDLQLIFPTPTPSTPNPLLDHVSVYCPKDTIDLMTQ